LDDPILIIVSHALRFQEFYQLIMPDKTPEDIIKQLQKENKRLLEALKQCLKARQINHAKQIIKEALKHE